MKKKQTPWLMKDIGLLKMIKMMRLTIFILLLSLSQAFAIDSYSQQTKLTLDMNNARVEDVIDEIENSTNFFFLYNKKVVDVDRRVDIKVESKSVNEVLDRIFENTDISASIKDRQILLINNNTGKSIQTNSGQQLESVSGEVLDSEGESLPGVTVVVKGTTTGTITDINGKYSISNVSANAILVFSFIGMETSEEEVNSRSTIDVRLTASNVGINEVVVTAMGIRRDRKSLGYAISKVDGTQLVSAGAPTNPIQSLYGKAAGVTIRQSASGPTGGININIRGAAGLQADAKTRPLFVVDGVPIFDENTSIQSGYDYGTGINDINAEDIESMEILKGAKASVLYGSEGANGVVLITTKSGKGTKGRLEVNASFQTTIEQPRTFIEFQNKYGSGGDIYNVKDIEDGNQYPIANYSSGSFGPAFDASQKRIWWDGVARPYIARPNNYEFLFRDGSSKQFNASVAKSGDFGNVRFSFTNYDYDGIMENFWQKKNTISFAGTFKLSDKFSIETSTNIYQIKSQNRPSNTLGMFVNGVSRDAPFDEFIENKDYLHNDPLDQNYGYPKDFESFAYPTGYYSLSNFSDHMWSRGNNKAIDEKFHLITTVRPTYRITDWLSVIGQASLDYTDTDFTTKNSVKAVYPELRGGYYGFSRRNTKIEDYKGIINFFKTFLEDRLDVSAVVGTTYKKVSENTVGVSTSNVGTASGFNFPNWYHLNNQNPSGWPPSNQMGKVRNNSFGENSLYSVFGLATITLDGKYTIELNARNDWSSSLPPDNNSYFYPGLAFTWDATEALQTILPSLQFGKFRASWADVGRDAPSRYYAFQSYNAGIVTGTNAQSVSSQSSLFAGSLKPERKREIEIGTEMSFFKGNRLGIDISVYSNSVYDQIMSVPLSRSTGATEIKINAGEVKNWGYELELKAIPVLTKDFRWDVTFITSNQFSKVEKLYPGIEEKNVTGMRGKVFVKAKEGERVGSIYGPGLHTDPNGNRIVSPSGTSYQLDQKNFINIGNVFPDFIGGFNTTLNYKGFHLYAHLDYSFGSSMYSETNQWLYNNGASVQSLENRDEEHGGIAYYENEDGANIKWEHNTPAPGGEDVYHDGIILPGVVEVKDANGNITGYEENSNIVPVSAYYAGFVSWAGEAINAVDLKYKNDYIKLREISFAYDLPKKLINRLNVKKLTLSVFARNVGYLYKTVPNLDPEAYMGTNTYFEASPIPSTRTLGMKLSLGF